MGKKKPAEQNITIKLFDSKYSNMKKIIQTNDAPAPIGPYNQAVQVGNILYTSGQVALNPATGKLEMESIETETEQVMKNLNAILTGLPRGVNIEISMMAIV